VTDQAKIQEDDPRWYDVELLKNECDWDPSEGQYKVEFKYYEPAKVKDFKLSQGKQIRVSAENFRQGHNVALGLILGKGSKVTLRDDIP